MPDALDDRLFADARRDNVPPPSFDDALATAVDERPTRAPWLAVAATAVVVCGAAVTLAATRGDGDRTSAAGPPTPVSSTADDGWAARAAVSAQIATADDPDLLSVQFTLGATCALPRVQVAETASTVTVRSTAPPRSPSCDSGISTRPGQTGGSMAIRGVDVRLAAPLGDRPVIDAVSGRTLDVTDTSDTPHLQPVPVGYRPGMIRTPSFPGSTDANTLGLDYGWEDRNGNTLMTHTGGRDGIAPSAPVAGEVDGVPVRAFDARFNDDPQHLDGTTARCVTWTPAGKQDRMICATASAFDTAALLQLAERYR